MNDRLITTLVPAALAISFIGFMGYYTRSGFVSLSSVVTFGLVVALLLAGFLANPKICLQALPSLWPLGLLAAWAIIVSTVSNHPGIALRRSTLVFLPGLLMAVLAAADRDPRTSLQRATILLAALAFASAAFTIAVESFGIDVWMENDSYLKQLWDSPEAPGMTVGGRTISSLGIYIARPSGLMSNTNGFGILAAMAFSLLLLHILTEQKYTLGLIAAAILLILCTVLTLSRGALLFLLIFIALVFFVRNRSTVFYTGIILSVLGLPAALALLIEMGVFGEPIHDFGAIDPASSAFLFEALHLKERLGIWLIAHRAVAEHAALGLGFGLVQEALFSPLGLSTAAHSVPLSILLETGLPGLVLMLLSWFMPIRHALSENPRSSLVVGLSAILVALYAHQAFDSSIFRFHPLHFMFCYLLGASMNPRLRDPGI